ncbi:MAG TPA: DUF4886 domain-containing protein [Flavobacteriales bacterium]|nr:DUF4886 domain-containing protein [Flavobacteriales bacterium]
MKVIITGICFFMNGLLFAQSLKNVLFIGNSYTQVNDLPGMVSTIASSLNDSVYHESSTPGGYTLQMHSTNPGTLSKINSGNWQYVVIQAQSQEPAMPPAQVAANVYPYADSLVKHVWEHDTCTRVLFYMTWGRKNGDAANCPFYPVVCTYGGMQSRLRQSYLEMAQLFNKEVCPVGVAWKEVRETDSTIELYNADESHPSLEGTYLAACTFYCSIFHKPVTGCYVPAGISLPVANLLQVIAQSTVFDSLSTWNIDTSNIACALNSMIETEQSKAEDRCSVWINAATGMLHVVSENDVNYIMTDQSGRLLQPGALKAGETNINISNLQTGLYFFTVISKNKRISNFKFTIIR